ncbi:helix-turn-helix domain-containing protein [Pedobacter panaciterrae]|jgi:AraC-type DNA-binding domain-containing proteins|uniref:Helix-turn-helix domain-containing protein n=1 Tax=Pedobacter panaciterrae TaxID=363849 RepID=A0ABU8NR58_9SPHI|nr:helix-turn-helix domain-containing protein [Pedobacter panaciterrae]NQX54893.1 AraC family transcriptional regulator [Pedobacter panaciterrae]
MDPYNSVVKKTAPTEALQAFVSEYVFRILTVPKHEPVVKAMPLRVMGSIDFFLGDSFETINCNSNQTESFARCTIRGPRTHKKYIIAISGHFVSFTIKFKPAGLYRLLGIPANLFCNQAIDGQLLFASIFKEITERLMPCSDINECIEIVEPYLLQMALKHAKIYPSKAVNQMTSLIFNNRAPVFLPKVSLSDRQLERNFAKEIGTTPKLYSNMVRFENLLHYKINFPDKSWTEIAYEFNYYDQMHLIKSFKKFLDVTPSDFRAGNFAI